MNRKCGITCSKRPQMESIHECCSNMVCIVTTRPKDRSLKYLLSFFLLPLNVILDGKVEVPKKKPNKPRGMKTEPKHKNKETATSPCERERWLSAARWGWLQPQHWVIIELLCFCLCHSSRQAGERETQGKFMMSAPNFFFSFLVPWLQICFKQ